MDWLNLRDISRMVGGVLNGKNLMVEGVGIDTRTIQPNQLFVALRGKNHDGHDFAANSIDAGAIALMVDHELPIAAPQIIIHDTLDALQKLASTWRSRLKLTMVALTGSNGKTTTKEMIVSILRLCKKVHATCGNLNNHIGVPLSLLELRHKHEVAVIELGANHPEEIRQLARMVQPDISLVTNAAAAHLEGFGSIDGVARAKGELFEEMKPSGTAVINASDAYSDYWCGLLDRQVCIRFGMQKDADVRGYYDGSHYSIGLGDEIYPIQLQLSGKHNFQNALAAAAVATAIHIDPRIIMQGLAAAVPPAGRLNKLSGIRGACVWDDTYNANPASLTVALDVLCDTSHEKWLVLGDMGELGETTKQWHAEMGKLAKEKGVDQLFTVGDSTVESTTAFGSECQTFYQHKTSN